MILINIYIDKRSLKRSYSIESIHNNRYKNTGKLSHDAFLSYMATKKPKCYIIKHVKNSRDLIGATQRSITE